MFRGELIIAPDILEAIKDTAQSAPKAMQAAWRDITERGTQELLDRMQADPGAVRYPIEWASDKQRRYVMAMLRRTGNLPYRRSGRLQKAWRIESKARLSDGTAALTNDTDYVQYVQGNAQQPFHRNTGWVRYTDAVEDARLKIESELIDTWVSVTDFTQGRN